VKFKRELDDIITEYEEEGYEKVNYALNAAFLLTLAMKKEQRRLRS